MLGTEMVTVEAVRPEHEQLVRVWADQSADQTRVWHPNELRLKRDGPERRSRMADSHFNFELNFEEIMLELEDKLYIKVMQN